jgi:predicted RND superfamily exporter protein
VLLDWASSPLLDEVARAFGTRDRDQGLFSLRLRESVATDSRRAVMARVREGASAAGLEAVETAGFYDLQAQLGSLIRTSLAIGITALLVLFLGVAWIVSRSWATTARMWLALAAIPLVVLGTFGWLGIAVDIVTSPAANVALAMGVDSMIHLVVRVRRLAAAGVAGAWGAALAQIRSPVLAASSIICAGFGIFLLSSFPPTRRFGAAVILGTLTAAVMALVVLPYVARREPTGAPEPATAV